MSDTGMAVRVDGLTKTYRGHAVVDRLSFEIPRGAVAGFVGPNGAGKTTTMAMLLGLVRPSAGTGAVLGEPLGQPTRYLHRVGAMIESPAMWPALSGSANLRALATLAGHGTAPIPGLLDLVGLGERGNDRFGTYSLGMKQRLALAAALLGDPALLILDEPANGLDPAGMRQMRDLITQVAATGRTVLVSSHLLADLEQICDWLLVIDRGALLHAGPAQDYLAQATPTVLASPADPSDLAALLALAGPGAARNEAGDGLQMSVTGTDARAAAVALSRAAASAGIVLAELRVQRPDLATHYLNQVEGALR